LNERDGPSLACHTAEQASAATATKTENPKNTTQEQYKMLQMAGSSRYQVKPEERINVRIPHLELMQTLTNVHDTCAKPRGSFWASFLHVG
jgi:hypothetical protein